MNNDHDLFPDELPFDFNKPENNDALKERSRQDLLKNMAAYEPRNTVRARWRRPIVWLPVIAVGGLLCAWLFLLRNRPVSSMAVIRSGDMQRTVQLPDSSEIVLNRFSEIQLDSTNWLNSRREVWLTGEAFFEIRKIKANDNHYANFIVHTAKGDIEVLGTSFNVIIDSLGFSTTLNTGSIQAHIGKEEVVRLAPGQMLVVQGNTIYKKNVNVQLYNAWKDGEFHFDHTSLAEVIELIKKYYKLKVITGNGIPLAQKKLSGNIAVKDSTQLFNALQVIMGLQVQQKNDTLIINK